METLKFIVREVNKLLGTTHNLLSFDAVSPNQLLQIMCDVLHAIDAGPKVNSTDDLPQTVLTILSSLQAIKYVPPEQVVPGFCDRLALGHKEIIYPILEWLLTNQSKIRKRAYLARYADKVPIPPEAAEDSDVMSSYKFYEKMLDEFWGAYKDYITAKQESKEATELQNDIKKMNQDLKNVMQRTETQSQKLGNIPNKKNLVCAGKSYRRVCKEQRNLEKQTKENLEMINKLEFQTKCFEEKWLRRGSQPIVGSNISQMIEEEARVNKIFFENQLPRELEDGRNLVTIMEKTLETPSSSYETLHTSVNTLKDDVQKLMNEKLNLYANTENKLGPFRKQVSAISQKKLDLSNEVKDMKSEITQIDENIHGKEVALFTVVGGEILHGEELKHFIAMLREKSVYYKQLRSQLQNLSAELGIESRTFNILKVINPSINDAFFNISETPKEEYQNEFSNSISEAKQICRQFLYAIELLKTEIGQIHDHLVSSRKESEEIAQTLDEINDAFEKTTCTIVKEVQEFKEKIRENLHDISLLEKTWKITTQNLDKFEYIFNRLLDEMITEDGRGTASSSESHLTVLSNKKEETEKHIEDAQKRVKELEEDKKREQETIEFFKHAEYLIIKKLEGNGP